jgi:hypothetical protein
MDEILHILTTFHYYQDEGGDGVEVNTDPTKNIDVIKSLSDSTFITVAVISNAVEIVAHNSEAAIYIVRNYGDPELVKMLDTYTKDIATTPYKGSMSADTLNEMLKFSKGNKEQ